MGNGTPRPAAATAGRRLFVIEAPGKLRRLGGILRDLFPGQSVSLFATKGHLFAQPRSLDPICITPDLIETNRLPIDPALLEQLLAKAAGADEVIVMTDPDQEGEVIAHDVARSLRQLPAERQPLAVTRVKVYEITRDGVAAAMQRKSGIEPATALPGRVRAMLDRVIGATFSKNGKTVGRIVTPTIGSVRQMPPPRGHAVFRIPNQDIRGDFVAVRSALDHTEGARLGELAIRLQAALFNRPCRLQSEVVREEKPAPWHMGDLLLQARARIDQPVDRIERIVQNLYESGRIGYPRSGQRVVGAGFAAAGLRAAGDIGLTWRRSVETVGDDSAGAHESPYAIQKVNPLQDPAKLDPETAILVLLTRRMIMCGRNVSWEKPAAGEVEALLATIELPAQDREEILELDWQRAVAPHPQWLQDHREPGYHPDPMDAVILRLMVEEKLGRPSTWGRLANKIFQSRVIDPDFGITERGEEWVMHAPEEFVDAEFSRAFETVLDLIDPNSPAFKPGLVPVVAGDDDQSGSDLATPPAWQTGIDWQAASARRIAEAARIVLRRGIPEHPLEEIERNLESGLDQLPQSYRIAFLDRRRQAGPQLEVTTVDASDGPFAKAEANSLRDIPAGAEPADRDILEDVGA